MALKKRILRLSMSSSKRKLATSPVQGNYVQDADADADAFPLEQPAVEAAVDETSLDGSVTKAATTTTTTTNQQGVPPSLFLTVLPYEIRAMIYGYLLVDHRIIVAGYKYPWRPYIEPHLRTALWPAILRTNRQVHNETASVLYGSNTFFMARDLYILTSKDHPASLLYTIHGPVYRDAFGASRRYGKYVRRLVTYSGHWALVGGPSMREAVESNGIDFANVLMLAVGFKGSEREWDQSVLRQRGVLEPTDWQHLKRYVRLGGHAEWMEDGRWLVFWGRR